MKKNLLFSISLLLFFQLTSFATIRLPSVISSNMVLQQQTSVTLWGWADPGEKIYITNSWGNTVDSVRATSNAVWKIDINTPKAGGPYTITLKGWNTIVLENVMIGEVWVCSGQSNMEMSNTQQIKDALPTSSNNNIRLFHIPRATALYPQDNCQAKWEISSPETVTWFSAVGYFFGKKLQANLNVPIGLIESAWGGTPAETWMPADVIANDPLLKESAAKLPVTPWGASSPGYIYNAMIAPIVNFDIAGAIWYQGEANVINGNNYEKTLTTMIDAWRKDWKKDFPFYYVQIAPYTYGRNFEAAVVMEQQTKVLSHPGTGMVVVTDLVDNIKDIHPKNKYDVGIRLANLALSQTYKKDMGPVKSPLFNRMEISGKKATLYFDNAPNGFITKNNAKATEFYVADKDRKFYPADVKIEKDRIIVSSKQVSNVLAVRFSYSNTAMSNLFSKEGLPVTPFRTDNWDLDLSKAQ